FVQAAPDAVGLANLDGVVEAGLADRARGADRLGPLLALFLLVLALHVGGREEHGRLGPAAGSLHLPRISGALTTHVTPFPSPPGTYPRPRRPTRGVLPGQAFASAPEGSSGSRGSTWSTSPSTPTTRPRSPGATGVARLVRARHRASRTRTMPSGWRAAVASPSSPTIDSRPTVGVEKRARTTDGMAASMNKKAPSSV